MIGERYCPPSIFLGVSEVELDTVAFTIITWPVTKHDHV
jgi:hypothetical protein